MPREKILERWSRLWVFVAASIPAAHEVFAYDNTDARRPYRLVAHTRDGAPTLPPAWPRWAPADPVRALGG